MGDAVAHLEGLGVNTEGIRGRASTRKRGRSLGAVAGDADADGDGMDVDGEGGKRVRFFPRVSFRGFDLGSGVSLRCGFCVCAGIASHRGVLVCIMRVGLLLGV